MMRLSYLIPRMIILALIALALWVSKDPLIKSAIISNLEETIGAKVEIGQLRSSIGNKKLFIKELAIANPNDPMKNLFQADMAYVEFDTQSLLHRRVVISHSQTSNVVFGAPRITSGALPNAETTEPTENQWLPNQSESIDKLGLNWLDSLPPLTTESSTGLSPSLNQVSSEYAKYWPKAIEEQTNLIASLNSKTTKLKTLAESPFDNPLRPKLVDPRLAYTEITGTSSVIESRLSEMRKVLAANRLALHNAYHQDLQLLRSNGSNAGKFDSKSLNKLLLTKSEEERVNEIVGWFHWFRQALPDSRTDFRPKSKRGQDMKIPSTIRQPGFLIRSIDLEGDGRFANQHTSFAGTAYNLSNEPELHDEPASFVLRAQGNQHVMLNCVLDRRGEKSVDTMHIVCPDLEIESQILGEENSLQVTLGAQSKLEVEINLQAIDDQISGTIVFRHTNVSLHVDKLNELAGGPNAALQLNQGLASLDKFVTKITLSGPFENYQYELKSDLGDQFGNAADAVLTENEKKQFAKRKQQLDQLLNSELQKVDNQITPQIEALSRLLTQETIEIADLRNSLSPTSQDSPRLRFR